MNSNLDDRSAPTPGALSATTTRPASARLPRVLGTWSATAVVAGAIVGASIFRVPATVASEVGGGGAILALWVLGGLIALAGALSLAELAAAFPSTGGMYVFLRETYGPWAAFLFGWAMLVVNPASYAGLALLFAQSLALLVPALREWERAVAAASLVLLVVINVRPVRVGAFVLNATTWLKIGALFVLSAAAIAFVSPDAGAAPRAYGFAPDSWSGFGLALILVMGAYDGWQWVPQLAGEVKDPARTLPRAIVFGVLAVIGLYLAANVSNLVALAPAELTGSSLVTADLATRTFGSFGTAFAALLVITATFSSNQSGMMTDPRVLLAMAEDGLFFRSVAQLHPRHKTPWVAVVLIGAAAIVYLFVRGFDELIATLILGMWPFLALSVAAVIVERRRRPQLPRPFRVPLYPFVPLFFLAACAGIFANSFWEQPAFTWINLGVLAAGLPVYWIWNARATRRR